MHSSALLVLVVFLPSVWCHKPGEKTLEYQGSNYTYGGDVGSTFGSVRKWCMRMGGFMPSIHSPLDSVFLTDVLVGSHPKAAPSSWVLGR